MAHGSSGTRRIAVAAGSVWILAALAGCNTVDKNDAMTRLDPGVKRAVAPGGTAKNTSAPSPKFEPKQTGASGLTVGSSFNRTQPIHDPANSTGHTGGLPAPQVDSAKAAANLTGPQPAAPSELARTQDTNIIRPAAAIGAAPPSPAAITQANYQKPTTPALIHDPAPPVANLTPPDVSSRPPLPVPADTSNIPPLPSPNDRPGGPLGPLPTLPSPIDKPPLDAGLPPPQGSAAPPVMPVLK